MVVRGGGSKPAAKSSILLRYLYEGPAMSGGNFWSDCPVWERSIFVPLTGV